ncbi:MAG: hypothetical protein U0326_00640 [Polyangiales bacterium]
MTLIIPPWPDVPDSQRGRGTLPTRYEDVSQCGRCHPSPMSHALAAALWNKALREHPLIDVMKPTGVLPILSRLVVRSHGGPIAAAGPLLCDGRFALTRAPVSKGEDRFRLDMWARVEAPRGRTWGPPPDGAGEVIPVGEVYGEHTLTRLFAAPEDRRVRALPDALDPLISVLDAAHSAPEASAALPEGAHWIDDRWHPSPTPARFGLCHTDSNQHVNSLVYPALLEDAALARLDAHGLPFDRFTAAFDLGFRKPLFAGERCVVTARLFQHDDLLGASCVLVDEGAPTDFTAPPPRARCYGRVELAR